jgi:outer membrane protein assembly factor BamE (lipoprotein component of BamABCDE complex)
MNTLKNSWISQLPVNTSRIARTVMVAGSLVLCTTLVGGCASTMREDSIRDQSKISQIVVGKSTTKDVQALLGEPESTMRDGDRLAWVYVSTQTNAAAYIPFVNMMGSGTRGNSKNLTITFNSRGVVSALDWGQTKF